MGATSSELVAIPFLLPFSLSCLDAYLFVVLLKRRQILTCLAELAFLHTLTDIPMHEGTLGVHKIELVVEAREDLCNGRGVADYAASTHDLGQVAARHHRGRLVVDAAFEASRAPIPM